MRTNLCRTNIIDGKSFHNLSLPTSCEAFLSRLIASKIKPFNSDQDKVFSSCFLDLDCLFLFKISSLSGSRETARKALRMPLVTPLILEVLLEAYWGLENKSSRKHKAFLGFSWNFVCHIGLHDEPTVQELEVLCQNYIDFVYGNTLGSQCYRKR